MIQTERVREYLETHGSITPQEALSELCIMRLASRISDLKKQGYGIVKVMEKGKNRFGERCVYAKYILTEGKK